MINNVTSVRNKGVIMKYKTHNYEKYSQYTKRKYFEK